MYSEENLYSVTSLVVVHIVNFRRHLVDKRLICIELIILSTSKVNRVEVHIQSVPEGMCQTSGGCSLC